MRGHEKFLVVANYLEKVNMLEKYSHMILYNCKIFYCTYLIKFRNQSWTFPTHNISEEHPPIRAVTAGKFQFVV